MEKCLFVSLVLGLSVMGSGHFAEAKRERVPAPSAGRCQVSVNQVLTVLLNSADKLTEIRKAGLSESNDAPTCKELGEGVRVYHFKFSACGNCMPKNADLIVTEDRRPSFSDGPVKYEFDLSYSK